MEKIDIVVTWVDGTDPIWLNKKRNYQPVDNYDEADTINRYRPSPLFKYWFRGIEKFAPWVNKIFFITEGHLPEWLNTDNPKLRIIKHSDYIPNEYLPTYNSNVVELNLHRIEELSEQFVLFNDDMFLVAPVNRSDFFVGNKIKEITTYRAILPTDSFSSIEFNNVRVINKHFEKKISVKKIIKFFSYNLKDNMHNLIAMLYPKINGYKNSHFSRPHFKSTFKEIWEEENDLLVMVSKNKFRSESDINHYLMTHWNIESGKVVSRRKDIGLYLSSKNSYFKNVTIGNYKIICINDDNPDNEENFNYLELFFYKIFPEKSSFEI